MENTIQILKYTKKIKYGYFASLVLILGSTFIFAIFLDNLRPIIIPIAVVFITFLAMKAYLQLKKGLEYNHKIDTIIEKIQNDSSSSMNDLNSLIVAQKEELKDLVNEEGSKFARPGLLSTKKKQIKFLKRRIEDLEQAKRDIKKSIKKSAK